MGAFVQLVFLFLTSFLVLKSSGQPDLYPPQVEVQSFVYNEEEANFTAVDTKYYNNNRRNVISTPGMYIEITCYASYPIAWKTDGYVGQIPIEVLEVRREVGDVAEESSLSRYSSRVRVALDLSSTGYYTCFRVGDDTLSAPIYVFVKNDKQPLLNSGQEIVVRGSVIPCRTSNPEILVSLLRPMSEEDNKYERVTAGYDPKVGFDLGEKYVYGNYLCITPFDKIRAEVIRDDLKLFSVFPDKDKVLLLENDLLNLTCTSVNDDIELEYLGNKTDGVKLEANDRSKIFLYRGSAGEAGSVTCFTKNVSHTWSFRFIETPRLEFDERNGAALCYTDLADRDIYSLGCSNPAQCNLLRNCLEKKDIRGNCQEVVYKGKKCRPGKCVTLENTHYNGIIQCRVENIRISREYFTGLDGRRYFDFSSAPRKSIIQISSAKGTISENEPAYFLCEANSFLLTRSLKFAVRYANGTVVTLSEDLVQDKISNRRSTKRGTISRGVFMNLTSEVHEVMCLAALWNSTDWLNATTPVIVKSVSSPLAEGETAATFFLGETGRNLFCYGAGHPQPTLRWVKDGETLAPDYVLSETKDGSLILHFPEITEEHQGDYVCLAKNSLGKDKLIVNVEVIDRNQTCTSVSFSE